KTGAGVWGQDMKGTGCQRISDRPVYRPMKYIAVVGVETENKAAVYHDAQRMKTTDRLFVITSDILSLVALHEIALAQRFKADEYTAQARLSSPLDQIAAQDGIDGRRALEDPVHPFHSVKQCGCKTLLS